MYLFSFKLFAEKFKTSNKINIKKEFGFKAYENKKKYFH